MYYLGMSPAENDGIGTMPTYRDLYPNFGAVGEKFIIKKLNRLYLRDCLLVLSKLSQHYYKYCQVGAGGVDNFSIYRIRCLELINPETVRRLKLHEKEVNRDYDMIFPELSMLHLIKLCLKNCDSSTYTKTENFPQETLFQIGEALLVTNSLMYDAQMVGVSDQDPLGGLVVNFTKQVIVDHNFDVYQKFRQTYFLFDTIISKYHSEINLEGIFNELYGVSVKEYLAFSFVVFSQFAINQSEDEDWNHPHLDDTALNNLKPQFRKRLLEDLLINKINYNRIDKDFFNALEITRRPLVRLSDGKIIVLSLRRLFIRLTDSVYFDILDNIKTTQEKSLFSKIYGKAIEDYFQDILENIDPNFVKPFKYNKPQQETPDGISIIGSEAVFFECKKKQFHTLEFLKYGTKTMFFERIEDFYNLPLAQVCERIADYRNAKFTLTGLGTDALIYPVIVCPLAPPIFSGGWDKMNLDQYVLPGAYMSDNKIARPEFVDLAELESIEEYLRLNPGKSFIDLISLKRSDDIHHNANWMLILHKNNINFMNKRLIKKYQKETKSFGDILFK